jgi:hypothetical protein
MSVNNQSDYLSMIKRREKEGKGEREKGRMGKR